MVLIFEVILVADEDDGEFLIGVILGLLEPLGEVVEGLPVGDIVHEDGRDGAAIVGSRDGFEHLLSRLETMQSTSTVSQICILIFRSSMSAILEPNSTPIVVSLSYLNLPYRNCMSMQDFPTPDIEGETTRIADDDVFEEEAVAVHTDRLSIIPLNYKNIYAISMSHPSQIFEVLFTQDEYQ
jgi:hypothetical protein